MMKPHDEERYEWGEPMSRFYLYPKEGEIVIILVPNNLQPTNSNSLPPREVYARAFHIFFGPVFYFGLFFE